MIISKEFLNKLKEFGLNSYESKIWTALLSRGIATAGELSDIAGVPRSRSYDILESLEKKGFAITKLGKPIKYIAVPPEEVIDRVKKRVQEDTEKQVELLNKLKGSDTITELKVLHSQGVDLVEPTELTGCLKGRNNLYNHFEAMFKNAKKTISIFTTQDGILRKLERFKGTFQKLKEKGIKIRISAPMSEINSKTLKELKSFAEVRHSDATKSRFVVVDGKELVFTLMDDKEVHPSYDVGVWINTPFFASTMEDVFNVLWKDAKSPESVVKQ